MLESKLTLVFLLATAIDTKAAKILAYYPFPSISHQVVYREITLELIRHGHNMTVITPDPMFKKEESPANLREINVHDASYNSLKKEYTLTVTGKRKDLIDQTKLIMDLPSILIDEQFKIQEVKDLLRYKEDEFDLILLEAYPGPAMGLTYKFRAPTILVGSLPAFPGNYETVGAPTYWPIYHDIFRQRLYNLTVWEKIKEFLNRYHIQRIIDAGEVVQDKMLRKVFGPDIPPLRVLRNNVDMLFVNVNPMWEGNYPVPPGVVHMGGLHQKPRKELSKDLQDYLDASENGVIYFSFGSNVKPSLLPPDILAIFEKVLSQLPYDVIWKWDSEKFTVESSNIKIFQWLPQADLLNTALSAFIRPLDWGGTNTFRHKAIVTLSMPDRHPKVKLFITQGGLQSTDEAITAGVPLIGVPMFGDQWYNSEKYVHHKIGIKLELEFLTEDELREAIIEVAENKSYRENIVRLRSLMQDQPQTPLERSIWWIEYVLRHKGAKHLRSPTANMSWSEFLQMELIAVIAFGALIIVKLMRVVVNFLYLQAKKLLLNEELRRKIIRKTN